MTVQVIRGLIGSSVVHLVESDVRNKRRGGGALLNIEIAPAQVFEAKKAQRRGALARLAGKRTHRAQTMNKLQRINRKMKQK